MSSILQQLRPPDDYATALLPDPLSIAADLAERLAATAVERDRAGGHPKHERELIRASGLLTLSIATEFGGQGADWATVMAAVRVLAKADSALAHLFGFHHLQLAGIQLYGTELQQRSLLTATVRQKLFWGNALNPLDKRTRATASPAGYLLDGVKSFSSGSVGSDWLTVSAWDNDADAALIAVVPTGQAGVHVEADWDAFGQRQTDSGNVHFEKVYLPTALVLQAPGQAPTARSTLRSQVAQLVMANLYLGIAQGAFDAARDYTLEQARPWFASGVDDAIDDPFTQHRYGQLWVTVRPAALLADEAARQLDAAIGKGDAVTAGERGTVAIAVAEAKVLAHRAAIEISNQMFELLGARATSSRFGFDRFWRNARVHTLHDPVDYKLRDLGRYALSGRVPEGGRFDAVREISLDILPGEIFGLVGRSGAGKSTLLRLMNLLEKPDSGSISVAGQKLTALGARELREARRRIGMIYQHFNLLANATVFENVAFPLRIHGAMNAPRLKARVTECLELVGLLAKAGSYPARLSGGQKQRVAIARALASYPTVLLCDEPTSALDPDTTRSVLDTLRDINARLGVTIVIVSHELQALGSLCQRAAVVEDGRIAELFDLRDHSEPRKTSLGRELLYHATEAHAAEVHAGLPPGELHA